MYFNLDEWLNLIVRWVHVFSAILWVGQTYYFTWLDGQLRALESGRQPGGRLWMVHSGGFYTVEKQKTLGVEPDLVHWFRWEAMVTWVSGFMLLGIVYYGGGLMVDASNASVNEHVAKAVAFGTLLAGWFVYDVLVRTPLVRVEWAFALTAFALTVATAAGLELIVSARAAYIHVGALFGTIMAANVWMRILPPQRRMIAAAARGEAIDPSLGAGAKQRSRHNTFLAVPVVFLMLSSHFPTATYGNHYSVTVMGVLILAGWAAAALIRRG